MKRSFKAAADRRDVYERVTGRIISDLEKGIRPWIQPWSAARAVGKISLPLRFTGQPYSGVNVLMLWGAALDQGFAAPIWMTYRQASELNANVRKGEHGSLVVYASKFSKTEQDDSGNEVERDIPFLRSYTVFNAEQIEGLPEHYYAALAAKFDSPVEKIDHAEKFFTAIGAQIRHRGARAYYAEDGDYIQIPPMEAFNGPESFYATLAHESTHWTKHPTRLTREFGRKRWGDEGYAREELVAELGSAFLCADLELTPEVRADHAAYLGHWLSILKSDNRAIFQAASHAQKAVDYLHQLQTSTPELTPDMKP